MGVLTEIVIGYIDPGSGGYLFQILIAGVMAAMFTFTKIKDRWKAVVKKVFGKKG